MRSLTAGSMVEECKCYKEGTGCAVTSVLVVLRSGSGWSKHGKSVV